MKRIATLILLSYYSIGVLLLPMGNFALLHHLPAMYEQCKSEDPDMDLPDFVLEHFLNLEDVVAHFESKEAAEEHEKPHQPFTQLQGHSQIVVLITRPFQWESGWSGTFRGNKIVYPSLDDAAMPSAYLSDIFHPPISA